MWTSDVAIALGPTTVGEVPFGDIVVEAPSASLHLLF